MQAVAVDGRLSSLSPVISGVPQGTVLGPVLFLLHIADIARGISEGNTTSSYVDDTRTGRSISDPLVDCKALQKDLESIYQWATEVNMIFNSDKFESLRFWPGKTPQPDLVYTAPDGTAIEDKSHLRDLGVEISNDLTFYIHIENTIAASNKLVGWALRSFRRRSKRVMLTIWKSLIQSKMDYCSQLWAPADQASISRLESVARNFTSKINGMEGKDYWERLSALHLYSQERRRERYMIILLWKISRGFVEGYDITFSINPRRGRLAVVKMFSARSPLAVRKARAASLSVRGSKLFNTIPLELRNMADGTVTQFKAGLDAWLKTIPDEPTIPGRQRAAITNSLLDQTSLLHP